MEKLCGRAAGILLSATTPTGRAGSGGGGPAGAALRPTLVAQTMQALALVLMGRPSEAELLARTCLEAAEGQLPAEGPAGSERNRLVASASNCLSEALRELGRLEEAEAACRKGLALREKVGRGSGALPAVICRLEWRECCRRGAFGRSRGRVGAVFAPQKGAIEPQWLDSKHGTKITEAALQTGTAAQEFGPDHPAVALSLQSLALTLRARQQLPAAAEAATRCLGIRAQHKSTADGPLMAAALNLKVRL